MSASIYSKHMNKYGVRLQKQQGIVLLIALIMVLLMAIVGLASIRGSGLQESMASNMRDMNVSFQAAESGLTVCEAVVDLEQNLNLPEFNNQNGYMKDQNATPQDSVMNWNATTWNDKGILTALNLAVETQPRCVVERLEYPPGAFSVASCQDVGCTQTVGDPQMFRITSVSMGTSSEIRNNLQTTYKRRFQ